MEPTARSRGIPRADALEQRQRRRRARSLCGAALVTAGAIYLASPYLALWSFGSALRRHDDAALAASVDWSLLRASLKQSMGLAQANRNPSQNSSQNLGQQDDLPAFGTSFVHHLVSHMIDVDVTPARLDALLAGDGLVKARQHAMGWPHGLMVSPDQFQATIPVQGERPVVLDMRIEQWRWKIVRITIPAALLQHEAGMTLTDVPG